MVNLYVLELENSKYYVGKTDKLDFRLNDHFDSNGSMWTKKYSPKKIVQIVPNCSKYDEDKYTLKYMKKYGIGNVRGGSFCKSKLSNDHKVTIKHMINSSNDKCYNCNRKGHFADSCPNGNCARCGRNSHSAENCFAECTLDGRWIEDSSSEYYSSEEEQLPQCYRCGRTSHYVADCYATYDIDGDYIE